jgi:hypothetical protein
VGETRVDLQHLLEDLRDAYTGELEETILTEVVANALDSGAARIRLFTNAAESTLTIVDDGRGMQRRELARYHDVAASSKARGEGIGFAGVGIKLAPFRAPARCGIRRPHASPLSERGDVRGRWPRAAPRRGG